MGALLELLALIPKSAARGVSAGCACCASERASAPASVRVVCSAVVVVAAAVAGMLLVLALVPLLVVVRCGSVLAVRARDCPGRRALPRRALPTRGDGAVLRRLLLGTATVAGAGVLAVDAGEAVVSVVWVASVASFVSLWGEVSLAEARTDAASVAVPDGAVVTAVETFCSCRRALASGRALLPASTPPCARLDGVVAVSAAPDAVVVGDGAGLVVVVGDGAGLVVEAAALLAGSCTPASCVSAASPVCGGLSCEGAADLFRAAPLPRPRRALAKQGDGTIRLRFDAVGLGPDEEGGTVDAVAGVDLGSDVVGMDVDTMGASMGLGARVDVGSDVVGMDVDTVGASVGLGARVDVGVGMAAVAGEA